MLCIHSLYPKTINIKAGSHIFSLQVQHTTLSPLSLITDMCKEDMQRANLSREDAVFLRKNAIYIGNKLVFLLDSHTIYHPLSLSPLRDRTLLGSIASGTAALLQHTSTYGFAEIFRKEQNLNLLNRHAKSLLEEIRLAGQDISSLCTLIPRLVGVGEGLTPGGDDCICGFLSLLFALQRDIDPEAFRMLRDSIWQKLPNTNDISAGFLTMPLQNRFSLPVVDFYDVIAGNAFAKEQQNVQEAFLHIGHSSGTDTLFGIHFAAELLLQKNALLKLKI